MAIYKGNEAVSLDHLAVIEQGKLLGEKVGHVTMLPNESVKISLAFEF